MKKRREQMRSIELFAGCGGLALGIARSGFKHKVVAERDEACVATLAENKKRKVDHAKHWRIERVDARDLDYRGFGDIDLLSAGPPCQPFSIGGKHLGPSDQRNMWPEAIRAVRDIRPLAFVFENVRGLLRPDFVAYFDYITLQLTYPDLLQRDRETWVQHLNRLRDYKRTDGQKNAAYRVVARAVNAADYGAAQRRHRAIFVGMATKLGVDWEFPKPTHSQEALAWDKYVTGEYWKRHNTRFVSRPHSASEEAALQRAISYNAQPREQPWRTVRDAIADLPTPRKRPVLQGHWQHAGARSYPRHTGSCIDEPAKALKAGSHGVPGGENMLVNSRGGVRYFTVREMARLQGFPDDYSILGNWKSATRQLGNAVPTDLAKRFGDFVKEQLTTRKVGNDIT